MPIRADWRPEEVTSFEEKWAHVCIPADGYIDMTQAGQLQVLFQAMSQELGDLVAQSLYHEEVSKAKRDHAKTLAWLRSGAKSDRGREVDAMNDPTTRITESEYIKARAYRKLIENRYDSSVRSHYSMKALLNGRTQEEMVG